MKNDYSAPLHSRGSALQKNIVIGLIVAVVVVIVLRIWGGPPYFRCPAEITRFNDEYTAFKKGDREDMPTISDECVCISDALLEAQAKKEREANAAEPTINTEARALLTPACSEEEQKSEAASDGT